jgi:hypothetical protein
MVLNGTRNVWYFGARRDSGRKVDDMAVFFDSCWLGKGVNKIKEMDWGYDFHSYQSN